MKKQIDEHALSSFIEMDADISKPECLNFLDEAICEDERESFHRYDKAMDLVESWSDAPTWALPRLERQTIPM